MNVAIGRQIVGRLALVLAVAVAALATAAASALRGRTARQWDPRTVAVNHEPGNTFLLRPGQILAGPGDAADVQRVLTGWRQSEQRPFGVTVFTRTPQNPPDPAREVLDALAQRPQGHRQSPAGPGARGAQPRVRRRGGGVGDQLLRRAAHSGRAGLDRAPGAAARGAAAAHDSAGDGQGVRIAVLDTGMFEHEWLKSVQRAPEQRRRLGRRARRLRRRRVRPRHVHRRADPAGGARRVGLRGQGARLARRRRRPRASRPRWSSCRPTSTSSTSRSAATPTATSPRWRSRPRWAHRRERAPSWRPPATTARAGRSGRRRSIRCWRSGRSRSDGGKWSRAGYSNHGPWVDATARGSNLQSTFTRAKTKVAQGSTISPHRSDDRLRRLGRAGTGPRSPRRSPPR